jgi:preprotein translocase subunit SecF
MIDIIGKRYLFLLISAIIILPGLISLLLPPHLLLAADFTGGTLWELNFKQPVAPAQVKTLFADHGLTDAVVQTAGENTVIVRTKEIPADSQLKKDLSASMIERFGEYDKEKERFESVGPAVAGETARNATIAVGAASAGILLYLWWAFRRVPSSFRYGVCAIIALLHDAFLVLGVFSILGRFFHIEIDSLFVTALLTVIGFSVHDTIVVFDRIRENMGRRAKETFAEVVNHSLLQTLGRSFNTSLTVVIVLLALVLFGGVTTRTFTLALLIGVVSGTYSSIFNASVLLLMWDNGELGSLFNVFRRRAPASAS